MRFREQFDSGIGGLWTSGPGMPRPAAKPGTGVFYGDESANHSLSANDPRLLLGPSS
jgi:hypothetical protein